jgi:uncharacterized membrane protein YfcA
MTTSILLLYLTAGVVSGLLAGLFGLGGGVVVVPALLYIFPHDPALQHTGHMHLALATSMATILVSSTAASLAHHRQHAVLWPMVTRMLPGCLLGTLLASILVARIPGVYLKGTFMLFELYVATTLLLGRPPAPRRTDQDLPRFASAAGMIIGFFSTLLGAGGGSLTVPYLHHVGFPLRHVAATSSVFTALMALMATTWFVLQPGPGIPGTMGFVYGPALLAVGLASVACAPLGAHLANRLNAAFLRRVLAVVFYAVACDIAYGLLTP